MGIKTTLAVFVLGCLVASCGPSGTASNPVCFPGGEQALAVPYPGSTNVPTVSQTIYIASSVTLDPNDYRVALSDSASGFIYGDPAQLFGPDPSPTPSPGATTLPSPVPSSIYYKTLDFALAPGKEYTVFITGDNCT